MRTKEGAKKMQSKSGSNMQDKEFQRRLKDLRERSRTSKRVTSELCGLTPDAIRRYESGAAKPGYDALIAIADHFDVSVDYLIGRSQRK